MSFIRRTEEPKWEEIGIGWYVYSNGTRIHNLPRRHEPFVEVVMRMLEQSDELEEETLQDVHSALRSSLLMDKSDENLLTPEQ